MATRISIERLYDRDAAAAHAQAEDTAAPPATRQRARGVAAYLAGQAAQARAARRRERGEGPR